MPRRPDNDLPTHIRAALQGGLHAFKAYATSREGRRFGWEAVAAEIGECAGQNFSAAELKSFGECLRRFYRDEQNPEPARCKMIADFLIKRDLVSPEDLQEDRPVFTGPWQLATYLRRDKDPADLPVPVKLAGTYEADLQSRAVHIRLIFEKPSDDGMVEVSEEATQTKAGDGAESVRLYYKARGWGIITPEDNLILLMKRGETHKNHYYFTLGSDIDLWSDHPIRRIVLYRHEYALEFEQSDEPEAAIDKTLGQLRDNIIFFYRVDDDKDRSS